MRYKIGDVICEYRHRMRLSQKNLAELIQKDRSTVSKYESNTVLPDVETMQVLSRVLNIPPKELGLEVTNTNCCCTALDRAQFLEAEVRFTYCKKEVHDRISFKIDCWNLDSMKDLTSNISYDEDELIYREVVNALKDRYPIVANENDKFLLDYDEDEFKKIVETVETKEDLIKTLIPTIVNACVDFRDMFEGKGKSASYSNPYQELLYVLRRSLNAVLPEESDYWEEGLSGLDGNIEKMLSEDINRHDTEEYRAKIECEYDRTDRLIKIMSLLRNSYLKEFYEGTEFNAGKFVMGSKVFYLSRRSAENLVDLWAKDPEWFAICGDIKRCQSFDVNWDVDDVSAAKELAVQIKAYVDSEL